MSKYQINMNQEEFDQLIQKLIALGEDKDELGLWQNLFSTLKDEEKMELIKNLEEELKQLQDLKK